MSRNVGENGPIYGRRELCAAPPSGRMLSTGCERKCHTSPRSVLSPGKRPWHAVGDVPGKVNKAAGHEAFCQKRPGTLRIFCQHPTQAVGVAELPPRERRGVRSVAGNGSRTPLFPPSSEVIHGVYRPLRTRALEASSLLDSHEPRRPCKSFAFALAQRPRCTPSAAVRQLGQNIAWQPARISGSFGWSTGYSYIGYPGGPAVASVFAFSVLNLSIWQSVRTRRILHSVLGRRTSELFCFPDDSHTLSQLRDPATC